MSHSVPARLSQRRQSSTSTTPTRISGVARDGVAAWNRVGEQTAFYALTLRSIGYALVNYKTELLRLTAQMSLGRGALIMMGGSVAVTGLLVLLGGIATGQQGLFTLQDVGVEAFLGFLGGFVNVRLAAPLVVIVALASTVGAGATAELGAMRINEEIDALEVMAVRSVAYLAATRVLVGVVVAVPLYCVALLMAFAGVRGVSVASGQSSGVYSHYFRTFLYPNDILWSFVLVILSAGVVMLIHTYYGYTASGGPAGVGEAVGRSVRASLVAEVLVLLFMSMAIYGPHGNFHLSG